VDVEQIMRDIRARIAKRHGIDLTPQQIRELAARRLEAILEPRHVAPSLMEQMRRAAGESIEVPAPRAEASSELDESALYASHRGLLRSLRRWLNPILKLFFNPTPLVDAVRDLTKRSNAAATREAELYARQAEWNALHFEILQRLVTEVSRVAIDTQGLASRIESLAARVDFAERRVRSLEATAPVPTRPAPRPVETPVGEPTPRPGAPGSATDASASPSPAEGAGDAPRRRRRRRRGRRGGGSSLPGDAAPPPPGVSQSVEADVDDELDGDAEGEADGAADVAEPATPVPVDRPAETVTTAAEAVPLPPPSMETPAPLAEASVEPPRRDDPGAPEQ
jgi:hypothetical protein